MVVEIHVLVCWAEPLTLGMRIVPLFRQYASKSSLLYGTTLNHGGGSVHLINVTQLEQSSRIHVIGVSLSKYCSHNNTVAAIVVLWCGGD